MYSIVNESEKAYSIIGAHAMSVINIIYVWCRLIWRVLRITWTHELYSTGDHETILTEALNIQPSAVCKSLGLYQCRNKTSYFLL